MYYAGVALVSALALLSAPSLHINARGAPVTLVRHVTSASDRYQYVPFDIAAGTAALRITYQYDRANGGNVVDLGLFEPGSLELGTAAFRGYSGGAKPGITISAASTTPGYRPGPLPPGQWHVLLGLYKVGAAGVDVTITIETESGVPIPAPRTTMPVEPKSQAAQWFTGALHTHTLHSDGTIEPLALMRRFRELKFDFVAVTDHNNTTHRYELGPRLASGAAAAGVEGEMPLWIVGEEVTTPGGHASVWGLDQDEWIDFRVSPGDSRIRDLVATARRYGALFSVNHPVSECVACGWTHELVDGIDAIEISNGRHAEVDEAIAMWDKLLQAGRRITAVGSSDWHSAPNPMDVANVRVYARSLTTVGILEAIRNGHVIVMRSARDVTPEIVVRAGHNVARIGESLNIAATASLRVEVDAPGLAGRRLLVVHNGQRGTPIELDADGIAQLEQPAGAGYMRFEIHASDGAPIAITNPVYLDRYAAPNENSVRVAGPHDGLGARSAPKRQRELAKGFAGYQGRSPWLVGGRGL